ncbi:MAG: hypothetical protein JW712_03515 [Dehalococcoidales bacterium]|nr:hypothetical protein [Dehalococcoidales bacterium]
MDTETVETLSSILKIKSRGIETDIRELAWLWEEAIREARFRDPRLAYSILKSLARSYLRGHGLKMGNAQGLMKHIAVEVKVIVLVIGYVSEKSVFDSLHQAGVMSAESFLSILKAYRDVKDEISLVTQKGTGGETD